MSSELVEKLENLKKVLEQTNNKTAYRLVDDAVDHIEELEAQIAKLTEENERLMKERDEWKVLARSYATSGQHIMATQSSR